jgi:hypothetical protein
LGLSRCRKFDEWVKVMGDSRFDGSVELAQPESVTMMHNEVNHLIGTHRMVDNFDFAVSNDGK